MKNKLNIIKIIIILILINFNISQSIANDIIIDAQEVDIKEKGNLIVASGSVNIKDGNNVEITGDEVKYNKINQIVEVEGSVIFFDRAKNIKASSNKIILDRNKNTISSYGNSTFNFLDKKNIDVNFKVIGNNSFFDQDNKFLEINDDVVVKDYLNNYEIFSEKIIYLKDQEIIKSFDNTKINYKNDFLILSKDISFNKKKGIFYTQSQTTLTDKFDNTFELSSFNFNLEKNIFKAEKIKLFDKENNILELLNGYFDINSNELVGSDFNLKFNKNFFGNPENDPRLVGRYIITNKSETTMKKSRFTTCKNVKGKCPAWSISADEVSHKKNKKRIEYKKAWLEVYDVPIAYFPYFFHPDPTVERQSGFLFPQFINSSNLGFSAQIPYFKAIDYDKDITISPRVYSNNNLFVQTEYRQAFKNTDFITDFSYNKKGNSSSHFFSHLVSQIEDSFYEMKIETVSNKDYLKKYQIISPLINDYTVLNSSLLYEKNTQDYVFSSSVTVIEDLSKANNDKYEYIIPSYDFTKETFLENNIFDSLSFRSSGNYRKYNTNVDEMDIINDFILTSNNHGQLNNLDSDVNFLFRNLNTYGDLSETYKEDSDHKMFGSAMLNLKYPLIKKTETNSSFLTPMISLRYSPNSGLNFKNEKTLISFHDLFKLDRINNKTVEDGISTTLAFEYKNFNDFNKENLTLGLGINLRNKKDNDLPRSSSLGQKTSDIIGYSGISVTENLSFKYDFSIDQNLSETNYSLVTMNYNKNNFKTSFEYLEKSNFIGDESYLNNITKLELNKSNSIAFETNRNIDQNLTNYYNLIYEYKNDCLTAALVYNKQFYEEDSINSGQNIFFKLSFLPFGTVNTPNLNE